MNRSYERGEHVVVLRGMWYGTVVARQDYDGRVLVQNDRTHEKITVNHHLLFRRCDSA